MALTPNSIRTDLKCGKGSISPGEKCTKGAATKAPDDKQMRRRTAGRALARGAGKAATITGAAMMGTSMFNFTPAGNMQYGRGAALLGAGSGLTKIGEGKTRAGLQELGGSAVGLGIAEGGRAFMNYRKNRSRRKLENLYNSPSANRGDTVWATGFTP